MAEYIEREALALKVRRYLMPNVDDSGMVQVEDAERYFLKLLEEQPTADVEKVRRGEWIRTMVGDYYCSLCGRYEYDLEPYCNCGAKMDGKGDGDV